MADNDDLASQLSLMNKINAMVQNIAGNASRVRGSYVAQFELAQKLLEVVKQLSNVNSTGVGDLNERLSQTAQNLEGVNGDSFEELAMQAQRATGSVDSFGSKLFKATTRISVLGAAIKGLITGFKNIIGLTKGIFGFLKGVADLAFSVSNAIISIPFRIISNLMDMAVATQGTNELRREIEEVRKQFGDLKGPAAGAILATTKSLEGFSATGLHAWRIFGTLAERLKTIREVATEMGATFGIFTQEFKENGGAVLAYQKALGISNEQMKGLASRAITTGKTLSKVMNDMTKQTLTLGKAFGIDQKLIGKDMAVAIKDVKNFGQVTVKEIGTASVYARKLGFELDKITGTLGAFETFDQAAENSAKLSQSFGVQIDAFKMMEAQNPAEQLEMLRQQFKLAGVDSSNFNRQQRKLLATSTGLDESIVAQAFSAKNYGVSLNDIQKKSEVAEKKQLSQAEAMSKLADSIERLVKDGPQLKSSFFDMFLMGIDRGIKRSAEFRELMRHIRQALRVTMMAGVAFGRIFVRSFDGVSDILGRLSKMFGPETFGVLGKSINDATKELLNKKNPLPVDKFIDRIFGSFRVFFAAEKGPLEETLEGFKKFFIKIADIVGPMFAWVGERVGDAMLGLADLISGKKKLPGVDTSGAMTFLERFMKPLIEGFEKAKPKLVAGATALFHELMIILKKIANDPKVKEVGKQILSGFAAMLFAPALMNALAAFAVNMIIKHLGGALIKSIGTTLFPLVSPALSSLGSTLLVALEAILAPLAAVALVIFAPIGVHDAVQKYGKAFEKEFGILDGKLAAGATGIMHTLTLGLMPDWLETAFGRFVGNMVGWFSGALTNIFGPTIVNDFKNVWVTIIDFMDFFGAALEAAWEDTVSFFTAAWPKFKASGIKAFDDLKSAIKDVFKPLADSFDWVYNKIKSGLGYLVDNPIVKGLTSVFGSMGESVSGALGGFSLTKIGEQFGDDLAKRVMAGYDKTLKNELPKSTKQIVKPVPTSTTPASSPASASIATTAMNESLKKLQESAPQIDIDSSDFGDRLTNMTKQISKAQSAIAKIKKLAPALQKAVNDGGVKTALDSIKDVVALVQKLDSALSLAPTIDVSARLERLATASGLGTKASYQVKSKEVVINLNLNIIMDVDKVEKVLIMRKESIIRDRLNFATISNPGAQASQEIPENYSSSVPNATKR